MSSREAAQAIDHAASRWAARLDRGGLTLAELERLRVWSAADARRMGALARCLALLER
jgi:transmembrane sensor